MSIRYLAATSEGRMNQFYYANEDGTEYHPPKWWLRYTIGALLVVIGVVGPCGVFFATGYSLMQTTGPTITPPGEVDVPVKEAGTMVVWVQELDSAMQTPEPQVPADFEATVKGPGNTPIAAGRPQEELHSTTPDATRTGGATFIAPAAGMYHVKVKGTFTPGQMIVITPDEERLNAILGGSFLGLGCLTVLMVGGGIALLIMTGVKHARHNRG